MYTMNVIIISIKSPESDRGLIYLYFQKFFDSFCYLTWLQFLYPLFLFPPRLGYAMMITVKFSIHLSLSSG